MSKLHFLNVGKGDCTLIEHNSGRNTVIDICKGNYIPPKKVAAENVLVALAEATEAAKGNFGMSKKPTNPINYFNARDIKTIFRLMVSHPDMDHLDGFAALMDAFKVINFWDSGVRREKPKFNAESGYKEADWDWYVKVRDKKEDGITVLTPSAGSRFWFANQDKESDRHDGLYILAPDEELIKAANEGGDVNDGSYVILYRSAGGRILIPGDAHDETWDYVVENYSDDVKNCSILFAPHHGRKSGRNFDFLDTVNPALTIFGCAESGHLAYDAWRCRNLPVLTNNQAGNVVMECYDNRIDVFIENKSFAQASGCDLMNTNGQGYAYFKSIC